MSTNFTSFFLQTSHYGFGHWAFYLVYLLQTFIIWAERYSHIFHIRFYRGGEFSQIQFQLVPTQLIINQSSDHINILSSNIEMQSFSHKS
jgi:hypothetical protein